MFLNVFLAMSIVGCISGGKIVNSMKDYEVLIFYEAKGVVPPDVKWSLIRTKSGFAILEENVSNDKAKTIINYGWKDRKGHHFVVWAQFLGSQSTAFEFIVPDDFTKPALRYAYPAGSYTILKTKGKNRPVPHRRQPSPVTHLIPVAGTATNNAIKREHQTRVLEF